MARGGMTHSEIDGDKLTIGIDLDPEGELSSTEKTFVCATGRSALPNGMTIQFNVTRKNPKFKKAKK